MKNYAMFKYEFLFGDHFAKASPKAKLLYVNLSFYADSGFVANPKQICKSMGYDESVLEELIKIDELLTLPGRAEMFITSYFVHNTNFKPLSWLSTPFGEYWKGKMWMKSNRIATLNEKYKTVRTPEQETVEEKEELKKVVDPTLPGSAETEDTEISRLMTQLNSIKNTKNTSK